MHGTAWKSLQRALVSILAVLGCLAAYPTSAVAVDYYYLGGAGAWDTSSLVWSTAPGGSPTANWADGSANVAYIGYLGTGGPYTAPAAITLAGARTANALRFGVPAGTSPPSHSYSLNGAGITVGDGSSPGVITIDLGGTQGGGSSFIYNNLTVSGGQALRLSVSNPGTGANIYGDYYFTGANSFGSLVLDDSNIIGTGHNWAYFNGANSYTSGANASLGNRTAIIAATNNAVNVGSISIQGAAGSYTPGGYALRGSRFVMIGAGVGVGGVTPTVTIGGPIVGPGDVVFSSSDTGSGGSGIVVVGSPTGAGSSYEGATFMNQSSSRSTAETMALLRLGCTNALPTTTDLVWGEGNGNSGALDMNNFSQTVNSIKTWSRGVGSSFNNYHGGITNMATGTAVSTLTINDSAGNNAKFDAVIGKLLTGTPAQIAASSDRVALALASTNTGSLTLGIAIVGSTPGVPASRSNTYSGGTTINGGALYVATGNLYSASGTQHSATGTGPVTVGNGGTLGGSSAGGAVGMPTTGLVAVNSGGTLAPGGRSWATAAGGPFKVLGGLTLNAGSTVNFTFDSTQFDKVAVGGALTLPTTGSVTVNLNNVGGWQPINGATLFSFASLTNTPFNPNVFSVGSLSTPPPVGDAYGFALNGAGNAIQLQATWAPGTKIWLGSVPDSTPPPTGPYYVWDSNATANFSGTSGLWSNGERAVFDDTGANKNVRIAAGGVRPGAAITFANTSAPANDYTIGGGSIADMGSPSFALTSLAVAGGGKVTLNNSNSFTGDTKLQNSSTLSLGASGALPAGGEVQMYDNATLQFGYSTPAGTPVTNTIHFNGGSLGTSASPVIDTQTYNVELSGQLDSVLEGSTTIGFTKKGSGELLLSNAVNNYTGLTLLNEGTIRVNGVATAPGQSYTALGSGNMKAQPSTTLHFDNVQTGVDQNGTTSNKVGWIDFFSAGTTPATLVGCTLRATGNSSFTRGTITLPLNYTGVGYEIAPGKMTFDTPGASDKLFIQNTVQQYDFNYNKGNWDANWTNWAQDGPNMKPDPTKVITAYKTGAGTLALQDGEVSYYNTFGGHWVVEGGTLQVGPFVANANLSTNPADASLWGGSRGQTLNALGFGVPKGQSSSGGTVYADPDLPNPVTVKTGGTLSIAVDQVNPSPIVRTSLNPTPAYIRNPITLDGGSLKAAGNEFTFTFVSSGSYYTGSVLPNSTLVTARLGGAFSVTSAGGTIRLDDADSGSTGRVVELVGGSRALTATTAASQGKSWPVGSTILYATNWAGTLTVDPGATTGGAFNIKRTAGPVTVAPGAKLNVLANATVNVGDGVAPVRNNVFKDDSSTNALDIANAGAFNVRGGLQTVGDISGTGTTSVLGAGTKLTADSIVQDTLVIGAGASVVIAATGGGGANAEASAVPEPGTFALLAGAGFVGGVVLLRRRARRGAP
jgi:autotransporter-associated beta strand protein